MAAGGQGAPLVAFADLELFHEPGHATGVHNLGGISNLTYLPADGNPNSVVAFDTGPGNCLLDEAAAHYFSRDYDAGRRVGSARESERGRAGGAVRASLFLFALPQNDGP